MASTSSSGGSQASEYEDEDRSVKLLPWKTLIPLNPVDLVILDIKKRKLTTEEKFANSLTWDCVDENDERLGTEDFKLIEEFRIAFEETLNIGVLHTREFLCAHYYLQDSKDLLPEFGLSVNDGNPYQKYYTTRERPLEFEVYEPKDETGSSFCDTIIANVTEQDQSDKDQLHTYRLPDLYILCRVAVLQEASQSSQGIRDIRDLALAFSTADFKDRFQLYIDFLSIPTINQNRQWCAVLFSGLSDDSRNLLRHQWKVSHGEDLNIKVNPYIEVLHPNSRGRVPKITPRFLNLLVKDFHDYDIGASNTDILGLWSTDLGDEANFVCQLRLSTYSRMYKKEPGPNNVTASFPSFDSLKDVVNNFQLAKEGIHIEEDFEFFAIFWPWLLEPYASRVSKHFGDRITEHPNFDPENPSLHAFAPLRIFPKIDNENFLFEIFNLAIKLDSELKRDPDKLSKTVDSTIVPISEIQFREDPGCKTMKAPIFGEADDNMAATVVWEPSAGDFDFKKSSILHYYNEPFDNNKFRKDDKSTWPPSGHSLSCEWVYQFLRLINEKQVTASDVTSRHPYVFTNSCSSIKACYRPVGRHATMYNADGIPFFPVAFGNKMLVGGVFCPEFSFVTKSKSSGSRGCATGVKIPDYVMNHDYDAIPSAEALRKRSVPVEKEQSRKAQKTSDKMFGLENMMKASKHSSPPNVRDRPTEERAEAPPSSLLKSEPEDSNQMDFTLLDSGDSDEDMESEFDPDKYDRQTPEPDIVPQSDLQIELERVQAELAEERKQNAVLHTNLEKIHEIVWCGEGRYKLAIKFVERLHYVAGKYTRQVEAFKSSRNPEDLENLDELSDIMKAATLEFGKLTPKVTKLLVKHDKDGSPTQAFQDWIQTNGKKPRFCESGDKPLRRDCSVKTDKQTSATEDT